MSHFSKNMPVWTQNSFNCKQRAVRIIRFSYCRHSFFVHILSKNLSIFKQTLCFWLTYYNSAFSMRNCNKVISVVNHRWIHSPWACCRNNLSSYHTGNMTSNCIKCQSRHLFRHICNFSIRQKTCLYQSLKTVANAKYKTIAFFEQCHDGIRNSAFPQNICNKFSRTIWFITCAESSR